LELAMLKKKLQGASKEIDLLQENVSYTYIRLHIESLMRSTIKLIDFDYVADSWWKASDNMTYTTFAVMSSWMKLKL
jgi:hypothetical protein